LTASVRLLSILQAADLSTLGAIQILASILALLYSPITSNAASMESMLFLSPEISTKLLQLHLQHNSGTRKLKAFSTKLIVP